MSFLASWPVRNVSRYQEHLLSLRRSFCSTSRRNEDGPNSDSQARLQREIEGPDVKPGELGPLMRPLGVTERPTTLLKTRTQKVKELITDGDARMAQRRHLCVVFGSMLVYFLTFWCQAWRERLCGRSTLWWYPFLRLCRCSCLSYWADIVLSGRSCQVHVLATTEIWRYARLRELEPC